MIEQVLNRRNVMRAYRQVLSNKGSAGVDGMSVNDIIRIPVQNRERIESELRQGKYLPQAILGVEIPKSNGKTRLLGIPTVADRLLQQAVGQVLAIKFEMDFEDYSYGFWHHWKKPERKRKNLIRFGIDHDHACAWSRTRKGGWAVAQSPILTTTITLERLRKRGYVALLELYVKIAPHLNEPLCTRPGSLP